MGQPGIEGAHNRLIDEILRLECSHGRGRRALAFELDINLQPAAHQVNDFRQGRHVFSSTGIEALDLFQGQLVDPAYAGGCPR